MHTLQWTFTLLTLTGFLRPRSWRSFWKRILYNVYTTGMLLFLYTLECSLILDIVFNVDNQDDFSDNLYVTLVLFSSCCKTYMLLNCRVSIKNLVGIVQEAPFKPLNFEEINIRNRFEEQIEWNSMIYTFFLDFFVSSMWLGALFTDFKHGRLKFRAWIPYDYSSPFLFAITFIHQMTASAFSTHLNIVCDCLFNGLMIHVYCQIEILEYRMRNIGYNANYSAKLCARHHYCIYKFASLINDDFKFITSTQFLMCIGAVCFNLYRLSVIDFNSKFIETTAYTVCLLIQMFYYCWFGNEVKLKSLEISDIVLESNLVLLDDNSKKILLMIMKRAIEPIEFTNFHIISMNLESFMAVSRKEGNIMSFYVPIEKVKLLKTSYSAFNVLQTSNTE